MNTKPILKLIGQLQELVDENAALNDEIEKVKERTMRPHHRKSIGLPAPRLQFDSHSENDFQHSYTTDYWLVIPLNAADIRAEDKDGKMGVFREWFVPVGSTNTNGGGRNGCSPVYDGKVVSTPFRDGAHAQWDQLNLGITLPVYAVCGEHKTLIEPPEKKDKS